MTNRVRVGLIGTSWWADSMYLPALKAHPGAEVVALCGRDVGRARALAQRWDVPVTVNDVEALLARDDLDAVAILTPNRLHHPLTMRALARGLHVLCEKPLAMNFAEAREMAEAAEAAELCTMVPFTYSFMPTTRHIRELLAGGYIGRPFHLNMRYYTGFARAGDYRWRFDVDEAGSGILGDLGAHFLFIAMQCFGEIEALQCMFGIWTQRPPRPDGRPYTQGDDAASLLLEFANGAQGVLQASAVCYEDTAFGQTHHMEFHGEEGTLYSTIDWDHLQEVRGARVGEGSPRHLPVPERIWQGARRDTVHNTYRDIFRKQDFMARAWITAIQEGRPASPDFRDGLRVQRVLEAATLATHEGRRVRLAEIV